MNTADPTALSPQDQAAHNQTASNTVSNVDVDSNLDSNAALVIEGLTEPVILRYFETFNQGDFEATSALFATEGILHPPFESGIVGPEAIAAYLQAEATGMKLTPRQGIVEAQTEDGLQFRVSGKVFTPLFGVNVSWMFWLNSKQEITALKLKLLASPQELLNLRR